MAQQFYTILTTIGKASIANATALGGKVDFKYMALGDNNGPQNGPNEEQTQLVNEVYRGQINHVKLDDDNTSWVTISMVVPASVGGFTVREVGVFDTDNNLLAVGKYPVTYKPKLEEGSSKDLTINMVLEVSNASVVNLKIDPSVILATRKELENLAGIGRTTETVKSNADNLYEHKEYMTNKGFADTVHDISSRNLDGVLVTGFYGGVGLINAPSSSYCYIEVISYNASTLIKQRATIATGAGAGDAWERMRDSEWRAWRKIIKDEPIPWINATLQNGWTGKLQYRKNIIGQLEFNINLVAGITSIGTTVAILPIEYRPISIGTNIIVYNSSRGSQRCMLVVEEQGKIAARDSEFETTNVYTGTAVFPIGEV